MFEEFDLGVKLTNGRFGVHLSRADDANELGYPTVIEVRAGPFCGAVRDNTVGDCSKFLAQLKSLYHSLSGIATLGSYEVFQMSLEGNGTGGIGVSVNVIGDHVAPVHLTFRFSLDQSHLPPIIEGIRSAFPPPTRTKIS